MRLWPFALTGIALWSCGLLAIAHRFHGTQLAQIQGQVEALRTELSRRTAEVDAAPVADSEPNVLPFLPTSAPARSLGSGMMTIGTTDSSGCWSFTSTTTLDVSSATACTSRCPSCFVALSHSTVSLTISSCSTSKVTSTASYTGMREYMFINTDDAESLTVTDGTSSYIVGPLTMVQATCYSSGNNRLYFHSNYGVAGANVATCPGGCESATPKNEQGATFGSAAFGFSANEKTRMGYLTNADPGGNVAWTDSTASAAATTGGVCASGNDYRVCVR